MRDTIFRRFEGRWCMIPHLEGLRRVRTHPRANEGVVWDVGNSCKYVIDKDDWKMKVGPNVPAL